MSREKVFRVLCVVVLVGFVAVLLFENRGSSKPAAQVFSAAAAAFESEELKVRDAAAFKKAFGFGEADVESFLFLSSDSVMEVRELLVLEAKSRDDVAALTESLESRVSEKKALFKNYAPEQSALLESYVLVKRGKFILYAVSNSPEAVVKAFKKAA